MEKKFNVSFSNSEGKNTILFLKWRKDQRKGTEIDAVYLSYRKPNVVTC